MERKRYSILQAVLLVIFFISAGILVYEMVWVPEQMEKETQKLKDEFPENSSMPDNTPPEEKLPKNENTEEGDSQAVTPIDLAGLQAKYPDVKAWITIPDTVIDYPVLQSSESDPQYYLKRNYYGEWDAKGSIFLQANCDLDSSENLVIYGHNMNSGAMFGNLDQFTNASYCYRHPSVFLQTLDGIREYVITTVLKADSTTFPFQQVKLSDENGVEEYVQRANQMALVETGEKGIDSKQAITLVTCSYEWQEARTIIVAVLK